MPTRNHEENLDRYKQLWEEYYKMHGLETEFCKKLYPTDIQSIHDISKDKWFINFWFDKFTCKN